MREMLLPDPVRPRFLWCACYFPCLLVLLPRVDRRLRAVAGEEPTLAAAAARPDGSRGEIERMKRVTERRPLQAADVRWILGRHQTCADCLRPQRFDYWADDTQWVKVVGAEVCLCIECYLRRCDAHGVLPEIGSFQPHVFASFDHDEADQAVENIMRKMLE